MASRLGTLAPRVIAVAAVILFATATLTFAAAQRLQTTPTPVATAAVAVPPVAVPDVTGQAYVFAKGMLEDAGFAWRVGAGAKGYAGYRVASQSPKAGTRVIDTGAPTLVLRLIPGGSYSAKDHAPDQGSPYKGTAIRLPAVAASARVKPVVKPHAVRAPQAAKKHAVAKPAAARKHVTAKPTGRTPAFVLASAPKEPLDEMPLTKRAALLSTWVAAHHESTPANVHYWIYQHAWIVTGARYGWSNGAAALRTLIAVDHTVEHAWGMGSRSEAEAQQALRFVEAHSR